MRLAVVPNGVELEKFGPAPLEGLSDDSSSDVVVNHVSNMKAAKRPMDLVAAATLALRSEPRLKFVVVGDGTLLGQVRAATERLGIIGRFEFTGWVERSAVPDLLRQAHISVLMSDREALPCAVLEAMASGLPVVASDLPATRELLADGGGLLYPIGDVDAMAERIIELARDPGARRRMGAAGRSAAEERRDLEQTIDGHEAVLEDVLRN